MEELELRTRCPEITDRATKQQCEKMATVVLGDIWNNTSDGVPEQFASTECNEGHRFTLSTRNLGKIVLAGEADETSMEPAA